MYIVYIAASILVYCIGYIVSKHSHIGSNSCFITNSFLYLLKTGSEVLFEARGKNLTAGCVD